MLKGAKSSFDKADQRQEDHGTHMPVNAAEQGNDVDDTDIPERMQVMLSILLVDY